MMYCPRCRKHQLAFDNSIVDEFIWAVCELCDFQWTGRFHKERWKIRVPVEDVPWTYQGPQGVCLGLGPMRIVDGILVVGPDVLLNWEKVSDDDGGCGQGCEYICYHD